MSYGDGYKKKRAVLIEAIRVHEGLKSFHTDQMFIEHERLIELRNEMINLVGKKEGVGIL